MKPCHTAHLSGLKAYRRPELWVLFSLLLQGGGTLFIERKFRAVDQTGPSGLQPPYDCTLWAGMRAEFSDVVAGEVMLSWPASAVDKNIFAHVYSLKLQSQWEAGG